MSALREWLWAPLLLAVAILSGLITAPTAQADPVRDAVANYGLIVCEVLDEYPTVDGVVGVLTALVEDGYAPGQAGNIVFKSVVAFCDNHLPVVKAFVDEYTKPVVAA